MTNQQINLLLDLIKEKKQEELDKTTKQIINHTKKELIKQLYELSN